MESWHRVLNSLLAKVIDKTQKDWAKYIDYVVFCYNSTSHSATGFAPHFIMTGQQPLWNVDLLLNNHNLADQSIPEYTSAVIDRLLHAHAMVRDHLRATAEHTSTWYNSKVRPAAFCVGDRVRVYNPRRFQGKSPKWQFFYNDTATVEKKLNDVLLKCWQSKMEESCTC